MFWSRAKSGQPAESTPTPSAAARIDRPLDPDAVLDALGGVLRSMGRFAFDTEIAFAHEARESFERWAQHLTIGGRHPEDGADAGPRKARDITGMQRHFAEHRQKEHKYVTEAVGELRQLVWTFVRSVHRTVTQEADADARTREQVSRLHAAAMGPSIDDLKREALAAVTTLDSILRERRKRQTAQVAELGERLRTLGRQLEEARRESEIDPLTRVGNRRAFDERLGRVAELASLSRAPACLIFIDIDKLKAINDSHGHQAADAVIVRVADALSRAFLRRSDFVARYGGDEFAVIAQETTLTGARTTAARLLERVREISLDDVAPGMHAAVSIGVAELGPGEAAESWLHRADAAVYDAKRAGRDQVVEAPAAA
jgi:diguanylate cyclase